MVDEANKHNPTAVYKLGDIAIVHSTLRKPPEAKLDKWQRRKLRKIMNKSKG
jgi:hypothetical protein